MKWITAKSIYVDLETGEIIKWEEIHKYHIIKSIRKITYNDKQTIGTIQYTRECRRCKQGNLFTDISQ